MPLKTFDDTEIELDYPFSYDYHTDTGNNEVTKNHYYTVSGNGYVVVTISVECTGGTNDYGSTMAYIYLNGTMKTYGYNRVTSSSTENQGGAASVGMKVEDGDQIRMQLYQSKNGAKTFRYYCLCIGCSVTYS